VETVKFYNDVERNQKYGKEHKRAQIKYEKVISYYAPKLQVDKVEEKDEKMNEEK